MVGKWSVSLHPGAGVDKSVEQEIAANLEAVRMKIAHAAERAGRAPSDIRLIAVSKTKPVAMLKAAMVAGQTSFGENYVKEALLKLDELPDADWHFIGALQTNKAKLVVGRFSLIHSVDRARLAEELAKAAAAQGIVQDVLMQVHVGDEATKSGVMIDEGPALIESIQSLPSLRLRGIMSLPPLAQSESEGRGYFATIRGAFQKWRETCFSPEQAALFTELSMGTSSDFEWAILEGATCVRIGTSIFGAREYPARA
jgi:hypothetical protein